MKSAADGGKGGLIPMLDGDSSKSGSPITPPVADTSAGRRAWLFAVSVIAAVAAVSCWRLLSPPIDTTTQPADDVATTAAADHNPGFVGPKACADCHARRVAEFTHTGHYRACRAVAPQEMALQAFSDKKGTLVPPVPGVRFEMTRSGNDFLETEIRSTPVGEQRTTSRIDMLLGDGLIDDACLTWEQDRLFELPVTWIHTAQQWGCSPFDPHQVGPLRRPMTPRCMECHNTWFDYVPGSQNRYRRSSFILGVTCERCHGPGREHVDWHRAHPQAKAAHGIVHPGRLPRERQIEVCTQCHSNAMKYRQPPLSYRPGRKLDDYYRTLVVDRSEEDHVANQVQRLRRSKCFQKSPSMTCITCHNPHRRSEAPAAGKPHESCMSCHKPADCGERPKLPTAVRNQCVDCHMPRYVKVNVNFSTSTEPYLPPTRRYEHRVAVHPIARQEVLLAWYRRQPDANSRKEAERLMNSLVSHWRREAAKFRGEYRFLGATAPLREALRLSPPPAVRDALRKELRETAAIDLKLTADWHLANHQISQNQLPRAAETLESILKIKPDYARVHSRLGTVYAQLGNKKRSLEHLRAVAKYDPNDGSGFAMLGWLDYLKHRPGEAIRRFRRADELEPFDERINYNWGLALLQSQRWKDAASRFRHLLEINPDHAGGNQGLAHALRKSGKPRDAVAYAERAATLSRNESADVLLTLADTYAEAGRSTDALVAIQKAIDAAERHDPRLVPSLRQRQQQLQISTTR